MVAATMDRPMPLPPYSLVLALSTMQAHKKCYGVYNVKDGVVFYFDLDIIGETDDIEEKIGIEKKETE